MKRNLSLALVGLVFLAIALTFCKSQRLERVTVGMNVDYPPFAERVGNQYQGIDIDIAKRLGENLGIEIEIVHISFDQLIPRLKDGDIDMIISAMTITPQRAKEIQFSAAYFKTGQTILKRSDNPVEIQSLSDFAPYTIGSQTNTTGYSLIEEQLVETGIIPTKNLISYPTNLATLTALQNGRCDFAIFDKAPAAHYANQMDLVKAFEIDTSEEYGIGFRQDYPFYKKINKALIEMIDSGEIDAILKSYGVD